MHKDEIYYLMLGSLYGTIDEEQQEQLKQRIENDAVFRKEYVDFVVMSALLCRRKGASLFVEDVKDSTYDENVDLFAQEELHARIHGYKRRKSNIPGNHSTGSSLKELTENQ
jgi:hypothetical protein